MPHSPHLQTSSLALLTDLYQLTMAQGYWKLGIADREAVFHLYFRTAPFGGGYSLACGLEDVVRHLENLRFDANDLEYLASLKGNDEQPLFDRDFLAALGNLEWTLDVDAIPEGTVVFPNEPLVRVSGNLLQSQLLETPLLNLINFPTLIATKAARVCQAAKGDAVMEFGLRRAQGIDGSLTASRAAYIGGCASTSNVLAGKLFGIPVRGTHAHSWVMSFDTELEAFDAYSRAMPNNCVFLVDTYNTLEGVRHAAARIPVEPAAVLANPGPLFEQWVGIELWKRLGYLGEGKLSYFRTKTGIEVDFLVEHAQKLIPIEVKWTDRPTLSDARHLQSFLLEHPKSAVTGIIVCRCKHPLQLAPNIRAIPWQML